MLRGQSRSGEKAHARLHGIPEYNVESRKCFKLWGLRGAYRLCTPAAASWQDRSKVKQDKTGDNPLLDLGSSSREGV